MSDLGQMLPRFQSKVRVDGNGCWLWTGSLNLGGYGLFKRPSPERVGVAHRYAYEVLVGPIPEGLNLDHLCRVRNCVNPRHVEPVTQRENIMRGESIVARAAAATHCPSGHPYAGDNVYVNQQGYRYCRACRRAHTAATRRRNRAIAQERA